MRRGEREEGSDQLTSSRSKVGLVRSSQAMFARFFSPEGKDRRYFTHPHLPPSYN